MLTICHDERIDAVLIEFESDAIGYAEELDEDRVVDYSANPGEPVGVSLHHVSEGVKLEGLPQPERVRKILEGLDLRVV